MSEDSVVIVSSARTPQGNLLGSLKDVSATELGATAIRAVIQRAQLKAEKINEVLMGCVLPAGLGQAPARQASIAAGIPVSTGCTTLNKVCGSGMKAVMLAHDILLTNPENIIVAGGMESMTHAPYLLAKARAGYRLGHGELIDHMLLDGLEDAYDKGCAMGYFAENCAKEYGFSRQAQDQYALASFDRARHAAQEGNFAAEIVPVTYKTKQGETTVTVDEHPFSVNPEKIPTLPPAFVKDGTVTAGNSCSIADGAAALILMRSSQAEKLGIKPLARVVGHATHSQESAKFTTAPIYAVQKLLHKLNWQINQVDLFEINEAFAVVVMAIMKDLKIPHEKINVHGGGCALGHPIGATGARIIVTLIAAMQKRHLKRGVAALCIGGGEATAVGIELM